MALQLKNKAKEEKPESEKKKSGKYRRKRNVFGKRTTRFGLIGLIIGLVVLFAAVKTVSTVTQNAKQKKSDNELNQGIKDIEVTRQKIIIAQKQSNYSNVGELIATLPTTFDRQATSRDLDRIIVLAGFQENNTGASSRTMDPVDRCPIEISVSSVKAYRIELSLYGTLYDYDAALNLINYLTDYNHENFYYIESFSYIDDSSRNMRSEIKITMYTFYNDVTLNTNTDTTTTTTTK